MPKTALALALILAGGLAGAPADAMEVADPGRKQVRLHLNGYAYHFRRDDQNEANLGLGLSYLFGRLGTDLPILDGGLLDYEFDVYRDSFEKVGYSFGVTWRKPLAGAWDWGLKAGLVHEEHAADVAGMYLIPYVLPFVESRWDGPANLRVMLTPPFGDLTNGMLTFQVLIDLDRTRK